MNLLVAFTPDQVLRLTELSEHQLRYWDDTGFFPPTTAPGGRGRAYERFYTFRDVVGLRTLALLRNRHKVPLQQLRKVGELLAERYRDPWASLKFFVQGHNVFFDDPMSSDRRAGRAPWQSAITLDMLEIARETERQARQLLERNADDIGTVTRHKYIMGNTPVIAGTRIPTETIRNLRQAGYTDARILEQYPSLTRADIAAALAYEAEHPRRRAG